MASLRHPSIVMYLGVCLDPPAVVTEYCARGALPQGSAHISVLLHMACCQLCVLRVPRSRHCAGSLNDVLKRARSSPLLAAQLDWPRRLNMALDAAKGGWCMHLLFFACWSLLWPAATALLRVPARLGGMCLTNVPTPLLVRRHAVPALVRTAHHPQVGAVVLAVAGMQRAGEQLLARSACAVANRWCWWQRDAPSLPRLPPPAETSSPPTCSWTSTGGCVLGHSAHVEQLPTVPLLAHAACHQCLECGQVMPHRCCLTLCRRCACATSTCRAPWRTTRCCRPWRPPTRAGWLPRVSRARATPLLRMCTRSGELRWFGSGKVTGGNNG